MTTRAPQPLTCRALLRTAGVGLLTLAVGRPAWSRSGSEPVRIGHQAPLSGSVAPFGRWHQRALEASGWQGPSDTPAFVEALAGIDWTAGSAFPQGPGRLRAADHLAFHAHDVERVEDGHLRVQAEIPTDASVYESTVDLR